MYCLVLADRYGRPRRAIQAEYSSLDIAELMALDMLRNPEARERIEAAERLEESRHWSAERQSREIDKILGGF